MTFLGTGISAILLPFVKKDLYAASPPLAKFALGKVPLISVFGFIFCGYLGFLLYEWLIDPQGLYGISYRNGVSVSFMLVLCILAAALFFGMRMHRRRAGMAVRAMCPSGGIHGPPVS